jgi:hypothetical protein
MNIHNMPPNFRVWRERGFNASQKHNPIPMQEKSSKGTSKHRTKGDVRLKPDQITIMELPSTRKAHSRATGPSCKSLLRLNVLMAQATKATAVATSTPAESARLRDALERGVFRASERVPSQRLTSPERKTSRSYLNIKHFEFVSALLHKRADFVSVRQFGRRAARRHAHGHHFNVAPRAQLPHPNPYAQDKRPCLAPSRPADLETPSISGL